MAQNLSAGKELVQDINTYVQIGKWSAILGTGYMLHKNRAVGLQLLARQGWAVGTAAFRLAIQISQIWYELVIEPWRVARALKKNPPPLELKKNPATGRYTSEGAKPAKNWKPWRGGGGGASAFFLFGGILVNAFVVAGEWVHENTDFGIPGSDPDTSWENIR